MNKVLDFVSNGLGKREQMSTVKFSVVSSQETGVRCCTTRKFVCTRLPVAFSPVCQCHYVLCCNV